MKKAMLTVVLAVIMTVSLCVPALAGYEDELSGECGEGVTWTLYHAVLTVSGSGAIADYQKREDSPFYQNSSDIYTVVIEDGVTAIGYQAFANCYHMQELTIAGTVTKISDYAFVGCDYIESIHIPDSVTYVGKYAFSGLRTGDLTIGRNVETIGDYAFQNGHGLIEVHLPAALKTLGSGAFRDCRNMTAVYMGRNVSLVDTGVFEGCDSLTDIYYEGSQAEWNRITFRKSWNAEDEAPLENATIHFGAGGTPIAGDANGDGTPNAADASAILARTASSADAADLNGDGYVNELDAALALQRQVS